MPLWILFFTALTLALHSVPAEAPEPEPSAPGASVPAVRGEPSPRWAEPLPAVRLPHKKSPACRKARSRRGIWFL